MSRGLREIRECEVCENAELSSVLDLGDHPLCDDLVEIGSERVCRTYPIEILYCRACHTAHQRFQPDRRELFPRSYHYRARFTKDVLRGMEGFVQSCEKRVGSLKGRFVLDIGCNDGSLLNFFRGAGARTVGIEPTGASLDAKAEGHQVYDEFLSEDLARRVVSDNGHPDIISFTNVFAHIEDLRGVLRALTTLKAPHTLIVIENHYLGSVLDTGQFDTFYHEHPRTYSLTSFEFIARALGLAVKDVEFPSRYGGNIRVYLGAANDAPPSAVRRRSILEREADFERAFADLRDGLTRWKTIKGALISDLVREHGPLRAKAFPGRAAILVRLLGIDERSILAVHEKPGSMKIGHYLPGTRIPIVSDDNLPGGTRGEPLINLAWHIPREIREYLAERGYRGPVIDILTPEDTAAKPAH